MNLYKFSAWVHDTAQLSEFKTTYTPECEVCSEKPHFVLTWRENPSGRPALASFRYEIVCRKHLASEMDIAAAMAVGPVCVSEYFGR